MQLHIMQYYCIIPRYAASRIQALRESNQLRPRSRFGMWQPVSVQEMRAFFAVILNMGLIDVPTLEGYWSTSWESEIPFFRRVMPHDRFLQIFWMLHVGDGPRRADKVQTLLDALLGNFQACYCPSENLAVDETMVSFRGRFGPKQYMPGKPTKYGVKAFTLASSEHGYLLNTLLYTGAETLQHSDPAYSTLPQPARVVMHLMRPYLKRGHHVYTDRYYSSVPLAQALQDAGTKFTGTCVKNRVGLPDPIRSQSFQLRGGDVEAFRAGSLLCVAWQGVTKKKPVVMLSTSSSHDMVSVRSRQNSQRKPVSVDRYNNCMNGVDRADQYTVYYSFVRRSVKWWRKVFFWMMEVAVVNSYILYKCHTIQPFTHRDYRLSIIRALAAPYIQSAPPCGPGRPRLTCQQASSGDPDRLNGLSHFLEMGAGQRDCVVCSAQVRGRRHRTKYYCKTCQSHPPLCPTLCFERYHTLRHYRL